MRKKCNLLSFLEGINSREHAALKELYVKRYSRLCQYANSLVKDALIAEDIVQECLIKFYHSHANFDSEAMLYSYLNRSVYRESLDQLQKKKKRLILPDSFYSNLPDEETGKKLAREEEIANRLYPAINKLPERQRQIILQKLEGASVKEISKNLGISEITVKNQIHNAYNDLRKRLKNPPLNLLLYFLLFFNK